MFAQALDGLITWQQLLDFVIRLITAMLCGGVIGYERSRRFKGAGLRTHIIVCCGAALLMIVSKYAFADLTTSAGNVFNGVHGADPSRIASQVVSGISFLGAGVIFKNNGSVSGLTTAAGLWATSGIGLAIGSGMYILGLVTTILIFVFQLILHKFKLGAESMPHVQISFTAQINDDFQKTLDRQLKDWEIHLVDTKVTKQKDGYTRYDLSLRASYKLKTSEILAFFNNRDEVKSVSVITA